MLSGRRLDLLDPTPVDVAIEDIARGLARVARWNGQTLGDHAFSVAQHSLVVVDILRTLQPGLGARDQLFALLHDAPEYVIGDMISPFKAALGLDYRAFEARLAAAIHVQFGLPAEPPQTLKKHIKRADGLSAYFEAIQLAGFEQHEAKLYFPAPPPGLALEVSALPAKEAEAAFLERFHTLIDRD